MGSFKWFDGSNCEGCDHVRSGGASYFYGDARVLQVPPPKVSVTMTFIIYDLST